MFKLTEAEIARAVEVCRIRRHHSHQRRERRQRARELMELVGLENLPKEMHDDALWVPTRSGAEGNCQRA